MCSVSVLGIDLSVTRLSPVPGPSPISTPAAVELRNRGLFHTTYKLFLAALLLQTAGLVLLCAAYGRYAHDGLGLPNSKLAGR